MTKDTVKTLKTNEFTMDYAVFGSGSKAFVILPGMSVTPVINSASAIESAYAMFKADRKVYVFDRIREIEDGYLVEDMARDTAKALELLGIENADIFGASQGGMMAMVIAARYPHLAGKLVLGSTLMCQNEISQKTFTDWETLANKKDIVALNRDVNSRVYSKEYREKFAEIFKKLETVGTQEDIRRFKVMSHASLVFDFRSEIENISCNTLVIGAECDKALSFGASEEIARALGCTLFKCENASHAAYDEEPYYKEKLAEFFLRQ